MYVCCLTHQLVLTPAANRGRSMGNQRPLAHSDFYGYVRIYACIYAEDWRCILLVLVVAAYMGMIQEQKCLFLCLTGDNK